jgi:hypothetical protein
MYQVSSTDKNGTFVTSIFGVVSGSSSSLKTLEPTLQQDLNLDGTIGPAQIANGATVEITGPYSGGVTFAGSSSVLQIDHASDFTGTVAGLAGTQDILDFLDIDPAKVHTPTLNNATSSGGTLNVTDGTHTANIALIGNYLASIFVASSDGHGGTAVHDPVNGSAQPLVSTPHA